MLTMKAKKPMKPMLEKLTITDEAALSSPNHPVSTPTSKLVLFDVVCALTSCPRLTSSATRPET